MKFGKYLCDNRVERWSASYVRYKSLKKFISMATLNPSASDAQYFRDRVEENVRRIETCFLDARNECFDRISNVHRSLPTEISENIAALANISSLAISRNKSAANSLIGDNNYANRRKSTDAEIAYKNVQGIAPQDTSSSNSKSHSTSDSKSDPKKDDVVLEMVTATATATSSNSLATESQQPTFEPFESSSNSAKNRTSNGTSFEDDEDEDSFEFGMNSSSEQRQRGINNDDDDRKMESSFPESEEELSQYLIRDASGNVINHPPSHLFVDREVFSHLPPDAHREFLAILCTLGKLKLFCWQNGEGLRKIIKKFDKHFASDMSDTLWPLIARNEFMQEAKITNYIAQISAVLCTRTIPFGHFNASELREKGVNLTQMTESITAMQKHVKRAKKKVPMNVEPRSYMANERTFLKWIRLGVLLLIVAMLVKSLSYEPVSCFVLVIAAFVIVIRSYYQYYYRNEVFLHRIELNWVDSLSPKILVGSMLLSCSLYLIYLIAFGSKTNLFHK